MKHTEMYRSDIVGIKDRTTRFELQKSLGVSKEFSVFHPIQMFAAQICYP